VGEAVAPVVAMVVALEVLAALPVVTSVASEAIVPFNYKVSLQAGFDIFYTIQSRSLSL